MPKVLITGVSGFVGSAVARQFIANGYTVRALLRASSDRRNIADLPVEIIIGDLSDPDSLMAAVQDCQGLVHVAADYRLWARDPQQLYQTNVAGTQNLMQVALAAGLERIVYTSSVATLGIPANGQPGTETTPVTLADMVGDYKRSKYLAEQLLGKMITEQKLPTVIVNPAAPIGPRDIKPTPTGQIVVDAVNGKIPFYLRTGLNVVHVDDVALGHYLAYQNGKIGERYILGGENLSLQAILEKIAQLAGTRPPLMAIPNWLPLSMAYLAEAWVKLRDRGEPFVSIDSVRMAKKCMYFSSDKAIAELNYQPRSAEIALKDAINWFVEHGYCMLPGAD